MTFTLRAPVFIALICVPASSYAQPLPEAATILDRFVEVTGGRSAYEAHHSEILSAVIDFPAAGLKGKLTRYLVPRREYSAIDLEGIGLIESGILGDVSWERSVILGPRIKQGAEKDQAIREAYLNAPIFWHQLYPKVETAGVQTIGAEECYEVILTPPNGAAEHQYFSKQSGLLVRTTTTAASQMGDVDVQVDVSDYRKFGGVIMPTRSQQRVASLEQTITVNEVRVNEVIPEDRFALPPDVAELLHKPAALPASH